MQNLYGSGGFFWFIAVVEDRNDPLLLGRVRVRILGYHNPNKIDLPTDDLPWASVMQSVTSAAMNGIGSTPLGLVEGTWVVGFFRDGDDCQEPVIMGSIGGVPQVDETLYESRNKIPNETPGQITAPDGDVVVNKATQKTVPATPDTIKVPQPAVIGPLTQDDVTKLMAAIGRHESDLTYGICNQIGFIGAYQMSADLLSDFGYIKQGAIEQHKLGGIQDYAVVANTNGWIVQTQAYATMPIQRKGNFNFFCLANDVWTTKAGGSAAAFLANTIAQDAAMAQNLKSNYKTLYRLGVVDDTSTRGEVAGYLAISHLVGCGGAQKHHNGIVNSDQNGTTSTTYYNLGFKSVGGDSIPGADPANIPDQMPPIAAVPVPSIASNAQNTDLVQTSIDIGFADPNKVYPKSKMIGEPDTNRLARHQKIALTVVGRKDAERLKGVKLPNEAGTWNQPLVPYNSKYPHNHVYESESGHIVECDDTAGNERTHQYHKSGTFTEIDTNGTRVTRIVGDDYTILERNGFVSITGKANVTVAGTCNVYIQSDCNLQIDGKVHVQLNNDVAVSVAGDLKVGVGGTFGLKTTEDIAFESGAGTSIKSGAELVVKATTVLGLSALAAVKIRAGALLALSGSGLSLMNPFSTIQPDTINPDVDNTGDKVNTTEPTFPELFTPTRAEEFAYTLDSLSESGLNTDQLKEVKDQAIADGVVAEEEFSKEPTKGIEDSKPADERSAIDPGCGDIAISTEYSPALRISTYFNLGQLSSNAVVTKVPVQELHGLTKSAIVCNLYALATIVLDPIKQAYPTMMVTSGFRTPAHSKAINSQHEFGQAADLQFSGMRSEDYIKVAQWIRNNVPFDQLLLEFKSFGSKLPWIHVSYSTSRLRQEIRTMWNDHSYPDPNNRSLIDLSGRS